MKLVRPPALRSGDRVALLAPSSPVLHPDRLARGVELLTSWGLEPVTMPHLHGQHGFLAGTDAQRLADLRGALEDPFIHAIWCARGGYGVQRLLDGLDYERLRSHPKLVVGFSDLTALLAALGRRAGLVTIHGPMGEWDDARTGAEQAAWLRRLLTEPRPLGRVPSPPCDVLVDGVAEGVLYGGNLSLLSASVGTTDQPDLRGAIVLIEEVGERPYRVDRMLRHLLRADVFEGLAGCVFGAFVGCEERRAQRSSQTVEEVVTVFAHELGVPTIAGAPLGHGPGQLALPLGVRAQLDARRGFLDLLEPATIR
ncbi:MAG: S66 peptidase family protein [Egibacteraceae bacterium]